MQNDIQYSYKSLRKRNMPAVKALQMARASEKTIYGKSCFYINPAIAGTNNRWVEHASEGLRFTGYADEINSFISHKGWYTSEDNMRDEILRGVVYQLPARNGKEQYIYGYADPCNDDCAFLCFDVVNDKDEAAKQADRFSERQAEKQREYNDAWQAGQDYQTAGEELAQEREETLELVQAIKEERKSNKAPSSICKALHQQVTSRCRDMEALRQKRIELVERFNSGWQKDIHPAFNDGAGEKVIPCS